MNDRQDKRVSSILLIGYGNLSRRDDGVAFHILQRLRMRLGLAAELADDSEEVISAQRLGMVFLHQLAPELAETLAEYDAVVFLDAHVSDVGWEPVRWARIEPIYEPSIVGHHLKPTVVLALCQTLYGAAPEGYTLSVEGHDFDFGEELSLATSSWADQAVEHLLGLLCLSGNLQAPE
jgi:hydrogenase maturation protease